MNILDKTFRYSPASAHSDPNYLRRKFAALNRGWNKPAKPDRRLTRPVDRPLKAIK